MRGRKAGASDDAFLVDLGELPGLSETLTLDPQVRERRWLGVPVSDAEPRQVPARPSLLWR